MFCRVLVALVLSQAADAATVAIPIESKPVNPVQEEAVMQAEKVWNGLSKKKIGLPHRLGHESVKEKLIAEEAEKLQQGIPATPEGANLSLPEGFAPESIKEKLVTQEAETLKEEAQPKEKADELSEKKPDAQTAGFTWGMEMPGEAKGKKAKVPNCGGFRETLKNEGGGAAYMGIIVVGGQPLKAIWDTGSDQQVMNSVRTMNPFLDKNCFVGDNMKDCYNPLASAEYKPRIALPKLVSYGSGDTLVLVGEDQIELIGHHCTVHQSQILELMNTNINQILRHDIDVVAGLAPHKWDVEGSNQLMTDMGIGAFSFCFDQDIESSGYVYWNHNAGGNTMPTLGAGNYWAVDGHDFRLEGGAMKGHAKLGMNNDFGAVIIDTGTSLIALDQATQDELVKQINLFTDGKKLECTDENLNKFPDITFKLGKNKITHRLRAQDYIMVTDAYDIPKEIIDWLAMWGEKSPFKPMVDAAVKEAKKKECVLMLTDPLEDDVVLLGMPFFRNYHVTFDRVHHSVHTKLHGKTCPGGGGSLMQEAEVMDEAHELANRAPQKLRTIDASKFQFSNAFRRLKHEKKFVRSRSAGSQKGLHFHQKLPVDFSSHNENETQEKELPHISQRL